MRKWYIYICSSILIILFSIGFIYSEIIGAVELVRRVKKKFGKVVSISADFVQVVTNSEGRSIKYTGKVFYKKPGMLRVEYNKPSGQLIVSNGKKLWIYIPYQKIVGEQDLETNRDVFSDNIKFSTDLSYLFSRYSYRFDGSEQPVLVDGKKYYTLLLSASSLKIGFYKLKLWINARTFFIERIRGYSSGGREVEIVLKNIEFNPKLDEKLFFMKIPNDVYIYRNPMEY